MYLEVCNYKSRTCVLLTAILLAAGGFLPGQSASEGAARLQSFSGRISVMRDATAWALKVGDAVQPQQVIVTGDDGYGVFRVADGSTFEVFPDSRVVFRANRGDWHDLLEVWIGKVRVRIEHLGGLPNHNKVYTPSAVISVRGTIFDVQVEDQDATTLVLDEEGSVEVRHLLRPGEPKVLTAGEWVRVYKNNPIARKDVDKGAILQRFSRAVAEAIYQAALNTAKAGSVSGTGTGAGTTSSPGDKDSTIAPPPASDSKATLLSPATSTIASDGGVTDDPISTSTLFSLMSLRVFTTAALESLASSKTMYSMLCPAIVFGSRAIVFFSGMPSETAGPVVESVTPILIWAMAATGRLATRASASAGAARRVKRCMGKSPVMSLS